MHHKQPHLLLFNKIAYLYGFNYNSQAKSFESAQTSQYISKVKRGTDEIMD